MSFGGKSTSSTDTKLGGIQLTQSSYGLCVPLLYGTMRINGALQWYGAFTATPHTETMGGKGGGGTSSHTSFTYSAALAMMLCEGQIASVGTVWADKAQTTLSALGFTLFNGAGPQTTWSYLTTNFPAQAIPYDRTAYVANGAMQLGGGAALPNLSFEVGGLNIYGSGFVDAEPGAILNDYMTNVHHGCGFPYLDATALTSYQDYTIAMGFFVSPAEKVQRQAAEFLKEMLQITNSNCVWSAGKLKLIPYADQAVTGNSHTYTPNMSPLFAFTDDDYCPEEGTEPVRIKRKAPSETFNVVRVEYSDRSNQYNSAIAEAKDEQDISVRGERVMATIKLPSITVKSVARQVAQLILQRQLYILNGYDFEVRADYCLLEPMDLVSLTDSGLGLVNKLVRITSVTDDEEDRLTFEAEEVLIGTAGAPVYNWESAQGYAANYNVAPGSVQAPFIFAGPPLLIAASGGYEIWIAVGGPSASPNWGGCNVHMSLDNTRYDFIGTLRGGARYGALTASLATGADPDTTHTLAIQLNDTTATMQSGTTADADGLRTPIYVDGEIMAYRDATLTGAGAYNLQYLRRGKYGSVIPSSHASASRFVRLDGSIIRIPYDPGIVGQTVYFKFPSFNIYGGGLEDISAATAYSYVIAPNSGLLHNTELTLIPRNSCAVVGNSIYRSAVGTGAWDSDCYSAQSFSSVVLSFRPGATDKAFMIGLNTDPTTDQSFTSLDHAIYCTAAGGVELYQSGSGVFTGGAYTTADVFSIRYDEKWVRYYQNSTLLFEFYNPGKIFFLDSSFFSLGAVALEVSFGALTAVTPSPFIARGNCAVSDQNVMKVGGSSAWDSDVYSINGYQTSHVSWKCNDTTHDLMIGLNTDPTVDQSYTSLDFAFFCAAGGGWAIYENGVDTGIHGTYTAGTLFGIDHNGSNVHYYVDNVLIDTTAAVGLTLFMDSSFNTPGAGVNSVRHGPTTNFAVTDTPQIGLNAATETAQLTFTTGAVGSSFTQLAAITYGAINFDCDAIMTLTVDGFMAAAPFGGAMFLQCMQATSGPTNSSSTSVFNVSSPIRYTLQFKFPLARGSSPVFQFFGRGSSSGNLNYDNGTLQIELIKR